MAWYIVVLIGAVCLIVGAIVGPAVMLLIDYLKHGSPIG